MVIVITMSSKWFLLLQHLSLFSAILFQLEPRVAGSNNIRCIDEEREELLAFKKGLVDEYGFLSSWGQEDEKRDCCQWEGVNCSNKTGHVNVLDVHVLVSQMMTGKRLKGTISPSLLNLQHLTYLDLSGNDFSGSPIPDFIGSLRKLRYLSLSSAEFAGPIPPQLGNLSMLRVLDLGLNQLLTGENHQCLSHLSSLIYLDLSFSNLSKFSNWIQVLSKLHALKALYAVSCDLPPIIPSSLLYLNSSKSLEVIDLLNNNLTNSVYPWLVNFSSNLVEAINLGCNQLQGSIPEAFGHMVSLRDLRFDSNQIRDIPKFLGNMCNLKVLGLSNNKLIGHLSEFIQNLSSGCTKNSLYLGENELTGSVPDLVGFSSLTRLYLENNRLNGTINKSIGQMSKLESLFLRENSLRGVMSEAFFSKLSNLMDLILEGNSLALQFSRDWIPPFQLSLVRLSSCKLGPRFPKWLQTQNQIIELDISNSGISDTVPNWFWDQTHNLSVFNLSNNQIKGKLPNLSLRFHPNRPGIDISSNHFEGPILQLPSNASFLNLSKNKFSGSISFLCSLSGHNLEYIDLSNNLLSGSLPDCWLQFDSLAILYLANNSFFGKIPDSMGFLHNLQSLSLYNNRLVGELPSFVMYGSQLTLMDFGHNGLSGEIPTWIGGGLSNLMVLSLKSNKFHGSIPLQLCQLVSLQIFDISLNNISGVIPKCFNNFTAMTREESSNFSLTSNYYSTLGNDYLKMAQSYFDKAVLTWKGNQYEYQNTLGLVKILDLSCNKLGGEVPEEIMDLVGLIALNLSRNNLTGQITSKIGLLRFLDFLDLSRNKFFGGIPSSLSQLSRLSVMDVSYNNFSGKIPIGIQLQSFNATLYVGNLKLCGLPLPKKCPEDESAPTPGRDYANIPDEEDHFITLGFYVSLILGFFVGFWGVCGSLLLNNSWRNSYYNFLISMKDWIYVTVVVNISKLRRRFKN